MKRPLLPILIMSLIGTGCSTFSRHRSTPPPETDSQKIDRLQAQTAAMNTALASLNSKLASLQAQLASTQTRLDTWVANQRALPSSVPVSSTEGSVRLPPVGDDGADSAFSSSDAIRKYRQSMILFESRNYPEAILAFSGFMDQYPDHALAGSAQYYLGECYFKQGEYKLATKEFQRVITSYDQSPHISDTLRDLASAESHLGQNEDAERNRQLLSSLFPSSPAGAQLLSGAATAPQAAPASNPANPPQSADSNGLDAPPPTAPMAPVGTTPPQDPPSSGNGTPGA